MKTDDHEDLVLDALRTQVVEAYRKSGEVKQVARELGMSPLKVRKLLISAGVFRNPQVKLVEKLWDEGCSVVEIQKRTGLGRASVYSYLPYQKGAYKTDAIAVSPNAKRIRTLRKRKEEAKAQEHLVLEFRSHGGSGAIIDSITGQNVQPWLVLRYHAASVAMVHLVWSGAETDEFKRVLYPLVLYLRALESFSRCVRPEMPSFDQTLTIREFLASLGMVGLRNEPFVVLPDDMPVSGRDFDLMMPNGLPFRPWFLEKTQSACSQVGSVEQYLGSLPGEEKNADRARSLAALRDALLSAYGYLRRKGSRKDPFVR